jgi:hypothetical protein
MTLYADQSLASLHWWKQFLFSFAVAKKALLALHARVLT